MVEETQLGSIGVVMDGPSGQRLAERLTRCGLSAHATYPDALEHEALAGQFFLAALSSAPVADALARQGTHLCLMPPWPGETVTIGAATVGVVAVERRSHVRIAAHIDERASGQVGAFTPLRILYRERLTGTLGTALAESEYGEPLLATLPRTSNMHGYIIVSSLQLGVASAQTRVEDVARLLKETFAWCTAHAEPIALPQRHTEEEGERDESGERFAPIVLLALALVLPQQSDRAVQGAAALIDDVARRDDVRTMFDRISRMLGLSFEAPAFDMGWAWLEAHMVVSPLEGEVTQAHRDTLQRYCATWQLGSRLRRLRHLAGEEAG